MPRLPIPKLPPLPKLPPGTPGRIIRHLARKPIVIIGTATLGVRLGKDAVKVRDGEIDGQEWRARAGGHVGSISGGLAGAAAGAVALSMIPGVGPIIGGFAGGMLGEAGGTKVGRKTVEAVERGVRAALGVEATEAAAKPDPPEDVVD